MSRPSSSSSPSSSPSPPPEKQFSYCLVARDSAILSEIPKNSSLRTAAQLCLENLPKTGYKYAFLHDACRFNCLMEDGYAYLVLVDKHLDQSVAYAFLEVIKAKFKQTLKASNPPSKKSLVSFEKYLQTEMDKAEKNPEALSKIAKIQSQVDEVKGVMNQNIEKAFKRGEKMETLKQTTDDLKIQANVFNVTSTDIKKKMWFENMKIKLILILLLVVLGLGIFFYVCPGFSCSS